MRQDESFFTWLFLSWLMHCYWQVIPTNVELWIVLTFSAIAQSRHSDGVLNSSYYCKIIWCCASWQCLTATFSFTRGTGEVVMGHWEPWWPGLWCLKCEKIKLMSVSYLEMPMPFMQFLAVSTAWSSMAMDMKWWQHMQVPAQSLIEVTCLIHKI